MMTRDAVRSKMGFFHRVKIALEWTIHYYAIGLVTLAAVLVDAFVGLLVIEKLKLFTATLARVGE